MNTTAAIERARKVDDEAFAEISKPRRTVESMAAPAPVSVETLRVRTQIRWSSIWKAPKRSIVAINQYFDEHPFWGQPVDPPPAIVVVFRRMGAKLGSVAKHCACGALGPVEDPSSGSGKQSEKNIIVLNQKVPVTGK